MQVSRELIAAQGWGHAESTVWRRGPGGYTLAASFPTSEPARFAIDGERVVRALASSAELYRCPATGGAELLGYAHVPAGKRFRGQVSLADERLVAPVGPSGSNLIEGRAAWRIAWDAPWGADIVLDAVTPFGAGLPVGTGLGFGFASLGADSLVSISPDRCDDGQFHSRAVTVVDLDAQGRAHLAGVICLAV